MAAELNSSNKVAENKLFSAYCASQITETTVSRYNMISPDEVVTEGNKPCSKCGTNRWKTRRKNSVYECRNCGRIISIEPPVRELVPCLEEEIQQVETVEVEHTEQVPDTVHEPFIPTWKIIDAYLAACDLPLLAEILAGLKILWDEEVPTEPVVRKVVKTLMLDLAHIAEDCFSDSYNYKGIRVEKNGKEFTLSVDTTLSNIKKHVKVIPLIEKFGNIHIRKQVSGSKIEVITDIARFRSELRLLSE